VIERFSKEVKEINKSLGEHEQIKRFRLVIDEWSPQSGELSPTLKLKRNLLAQHYKELITDIYSRGDNSPNMIGRIKNGINGILKNLPRF
jgi:long-chain acyl-CoA synthetase